MEILGSIIHKKIVRLYSFLTSFDYNPLVYEYLPNENLSITIVSSTGPLSIRSHLRLRKGWLMSTMISYSRLFTMTS